MIKLTIIFKNVKIKNKLLYILPTTKMKNIILEKNPEKIFNFLKVKLKFDKMFLFTIKDDLINNISLDSICGNVKTEKIFYFTKKALLNVKGTELFKLLGIDYSKNNIIYPLISDRKDYLFLVLEREKKKFTKSYLTKIKSIIPYIFVYYFRARYKNEKKRTDGIIKSLVEMSSLIVSEKNLEETLNILVSVVARVMNYKICSIMLYDKEKEELVIKATQSLSEEYKNKSNVKIGQSVSGLAVKGKKIISVLDVTTDPLYKYPEIAKKEGLKSMLAVPMTVKSKIIGVINVYTNAIHVFSDEEIKILSAVSNLAAIAIENAQLKEETLKAKDALENRKIIDRAKGILMTNNNLTEEEAYNIIRKKAMSIAKPMKEVASAIILNYELGKQKGK